ncbi:hypothetical protein BpHYR1_023437 [Brachionus plicatilis]|uniref:Uncharacterized protein n=1 Tax=Brachionus plicatilis TaxID=10195 RepID=A0A3M7Q5X7_BRAPC|nr:hypothetical protein BpHYR1_023437 [Brachionus plicatilis]
MIANNLHKTSISFEIWAWSKVDHLITKFTLKKSSIDPLNQLKKLMNIGVLYPESPFIFELKKIP